LCGVGCPTGYYPSALRCDFNCGSGCTTYNSTTCTQVGGASFSSCGAVCPTGYHVTARRCDFNCGSGCTSSNSVMCTAD
jgi:hypothetical protein